MSGLARMPYLTHAPELKDTPSLPTAGCPVLHDAGCSSLVNRKDWETAPRQAMAVLGSSRYEGKGRYEMSLARQHTGWGADWCLICLLLMPSELAGRLSCAMNGATLSQAWHGRPTVLVIGEAKAEGSQVQGRLSSKESLGPAWAT